MRPPRLSIYAHLAVLQKFRARRAKEENPQARANLETLIAIYSRMYE